MAAAVSAPTRAAKGDTVTIAATGFAATHSITLKITGAEGSFALSADGTTDGSGNITWTNIITLEALGTTNWSVTDGTTTKTGLIQVFSS